MPVSETQVRIPMPVETTGDGLSAMLSAARAPKASAAPQAKSAPAPAGPQGPAAPSPASTTPHAPATPGAAERVASGSFPLPAAPAAKRPAEGAMSHNDPNTAANGRFTIDEHGKVVPAPTKKQVVEEKPDPDDVTFEEEPETPAEPKAEEKPVEKPAETPAEIKPAEPLPFTQQTRDYSIFDPADVEVLKKLPNAAFNRLSERFLEAKKNSAELDTLRKEVAARPKEPTYLHEHPEAYLLQPEFSKLLEAEDTTSKYVNFYQEQLVKAAEGEDFHIINEAGQLQEVKLNGRVNMRYNIALQSELNRQMQLQAQAKQSVQQFQTRYKQGVANVQSQLKQINDTLFPGFDVNKLNPAEKQVYDYAINQLTPEPLRNSPQTELLAKAYVEYSKLHTSSSARIAELEKKLAAYEQKKVSPNPLPLGQGTPQEDVVPFELED